MYEWPLHQDLTIGISAILAQASCHKIWNVSAVTSMVGLFHMAIAFNQPVKNGMYR